MRNLYNSLLEDGDLFHVLEGATGQWRHDKEMFAEYYKMVNDINVTNFEDITE